MTAWRGKRVLIVDDNRVDRLVLRQILKRIGFRDIHEAEDGSIADFKIHNLVAMYDGFDLIFLDYNMPRRGGLQLLKAIRSDRLTKDVKVIMVTASSDKDVVVDSMLAGVDEYMVKPIDADVVLAKVKKVLP